MVSRTYNTTPPVHPLVYSYVLQRPATQCCPPPHLHTFCYMSPGPHLRNPCTLVPAFQHTRHTVADTLTTAVQLLLAVAACPPLSCILSCTFSVNTTPISAHTHTGGGADASVVVVGQMLASMHVYMQSLSTHTRTLQSLYSGGSGLKYHVSISCMPSWITSTFFTCRHHDGAACVNTQINTTRHSTRGTHFNTCSTHVLFEHSSGHVAGPAAGGGASLLPSPTNRTA